jgi:hypothetical protein
MTSKQNETNQELSTDEFSRAEFESHLPYMGLQLSDITVQQEKLVHLMASGMTIAAAGRAAGYKSYDSARDAARRPSVKQALEYFREQMREEVKFTRAHAHSMYMEAYQASATATEMKSTVDSLVKLHGLSQPDTAVQVNVNMNATAKQLERLTDEELLEIAGRSTAYLEPQ